MEFEYSLLAKYLAGAISSEELFAIQAWAERSERNEELWKEVIALRMKDRFDLYTSSEQVNKALMRIEKKIERRSKRLSLRRVLQYAAVLFVLLGGGMLSFFIHVPTENYLSIYVDAEEYVKKVTLNDGSEIWLRGGSTLRIPADFTADHRSVKIEGEGYFSIKKDSLSPFVVQANDMFVRVLGTTFNLKTDVKEHKVETTLISGRVVLQDNQEKTMLDMRPGEKVVFDAKNRTLNVEQVDVNVQALWRLNQSVLENMTLGEIAERIAEIYQVHFNFSTKQLMDKKYRFVFNGEESIKDICSNLEYIASVRCRIEGREIFVTNQN